MTFEFHPGGRAASCATVVVAILVCVAIPGLFNTAVDNRLERWTDPLGESAQRYDAFGNTFGNDEFALVAYEGPNVFDETALDTQLDVLESLEAFPMVSRVISVPSVYRDNFGSEDPDALKQDFLDTPFYRRFLISDTGTMAAYFILVAPTTEPDARTQLAADLREAAAPLSAQGFAVYHAGSPVLNAAMDETSMREARVVFPLAFVVAVTMLVIFLRSLRGAGIAIACATLSTGATMGVAGHLDIPLNMMTSVLPALLWVLTLANPIHIIRRFQRESEDVADRREAVQIALRAMALPCVLSSLTTAAGFMSLAAATLAPVREFGAFAALGFVLSLAVSLTIVPPLLLMFGASRRPSRSHGIAERLLALVEVMQHHPKSILSVAAVFAVVAVACVPLVSLDSNPLTFFDEDAGIVDAYRHIGDRLTGLYSLEMVVRTPNGWLNNESWTELDRIGDAISVVPGVTRVLSPLDILKKANQWDHDFDPESYTLPASREDALRLIEELGPAEQDFLNQQVANDGHEVRLTVLAHTMTNSGLFAIVDSADRELATLPKLFKGYSTGLVPHLVQSQEKLVDTQIRTIIIAFVVVFLCILVGLRSVSLTLLSIPPNLIPIFAALFAMVLFRISLDVATVMTASVALGIAVDDTVHMLTAYRRQRLSGQPVHQSWQTTLQSVGPAIVITTITGCSAFAMLSFSDFVPLRHFGQLAALAIALAFVADVLLLPALVNVLTANRGSGNIAGK